MSGSGCEKPGAYRGQRRAAARWHRAALSALVLVAGTSWGGARAQVPPESNENNKNIVSLPESRALEVEFKRAEALAAGGRWKQAARIWLSILEEQDRARGGIQHVAEVESGRYVSYARLVRERLLALPEAGLEAVRALSDSEAGRLFERARRARDPVLFDRVWRRYPVSSLADDALEWLGDLAFERGHGEQAGMFYAAVKNIPGADRAEAVLERKRSAAHALSEEFMRAHVERIRREHLEPWDDLEWGFRRASPSALGSMRASHPILPPGAAARAWLRRVRSSGASRPFVVRRVQRFADIVAAITGDRLIVATGRSIACFELESGRRLWRQQPWHAEDHNPDLFYGVTIAGDLAIAPFVNKVSRPEHYRGIPIKVPIPTRRLVAFDVETGKRVWDHAESDDPFLRNASVALAPVAFDGRLYAGALVRQGQVKNYLICLDAATGALLWRRYLGAGQVEMTMFGEHAREPLAMQPVVAGGMVYHATGTGVFACVAALSGELQWLVRYEDIPIRSARSYYAIERKLVWANVRPLVTGDLVIVTPIDSRRCYAFDRREGRTRWWLEGPASGRLVGIHDGRLVVFGRQRGLLVDVRSGKREYEFELDEEQQHQGRFAQPGQAGAGRAAVLGDTLLVPELGLVRRFDLRRRAHLLPWLMTGAGAEQSGSLVVTERWAVMANPGRVTTYRLRPVPLQTR